MESWKEHARGRFANHEATLVQSDKNFFIVDWRNKNGSCDYYVRFMLDIKLGTLIIQGDLGDCIARWYNNVTPKQLYSYVNTPEYFIGKFRVTSDDFTYMYKDALEDLEELKQRYLEGYRIPPDEVEKDFDILGEFINDDELRFGPDFFLGEGWGSIMYQYSDEPYVTFGELGKRVSARVYLWIEGYRMACEQLGIVKEK